LSSRKTKNKKTQKPCPGTHNSYHQLTKDTLPMFNYSHSPIQVQLSCLGSRRFEFDIWPSPSPSLSTGANSSSSITTNTTTTMKVSHLLSYDNQSSCQDLSSCLQLIREWSIRHPAHIPIMIWLENKEDMTTNQWGNIPFFFLISPTKLSLSLCQVNWILFF